MFKEWLKDKWENLKCFLCVLEINISCWLNRFNIYLAEKNLVKVCTVYDVLYYDLPIAQISIYDKLYKHYDIINERIGIYGELNNPNILMSDLKFKSKSSIIISFFKTTVKY